jgi:hypothetical protein
MNQKTADGQMMPGAAQNADKQKAMDETEVRLGYNGGVV